MIYFDENIAKKVGVNAAIIHEYIRFWIEDNNENLKEHDGKLWVYLSQNKIQKRFEFLTTRQIEYALNKLVKNGLISKQKLSVDCRNQTLFYTLNSNETKMGNAFHKIVESPFHNFVECYIGIEDIKKEKAENPPPFLNPSMQPVDLHTTLAHQALSAWRTLHPTFTNLEHQKICSWADEIQKYLKHRPDRTTRVIGSIIYYKMIADGFKINAKIDTFWVNNVSTIPKLLNGTNADGIFYLDLVAECVNEGMQNDNVFRKKFNEEFTKLKQTNPFIVQDVHHN